MTLERRFGPSIYFSPTDGNTGTASEPTIPLSEIKENPGITVIKRQTPLSPFLYFVLDELRSRYGISKTAALHEAHDDFEDADIRWNTIRRTGTQPFLDPLDGTGFEGYFAGFYHEPIPVVKHLLKNAKLILDSAREDIGGTQLDRVLNVIKGKEFSLPAFEYAEQMFLLLREITISDTNSKNAVRYGESKFSNTVRSLVEKHGILRFSTEDPNGIVQEIELPEKRDIVTLTKPRLTSQQLQAVLSTDKDRFTWKEVIDLLGQTGHPAARLLSKKRDYDRRHEEPGTRINIDDARYQMFVARMNARQAGVPNLPLIPLKHD